MLIEQLRWSFLWFAAISVLGAWGYHLIEGWSWSDSLWMVMITLTTIGYGEVHALSNEGRVFTIGLVTVGLGLGTYTLGQLSQYLLEGDFLAEIRTRRRRRIMEGLKDHIIVVGSGRLGKEVTAELLHRSWPVVVIDHEAEVLDAQQEAPGDAPKPTLVLVGDGSDDGLLERAGIRKARAIAVATGTDATNVFVTLTARQLNPQIHIVTRVNDERSGEKAVRAGADTVINPYGIGGARMAQGLLHPHAAQLLDQAVGRAHEEFEIEDVPIESPGYNGTLGELNIPDRHGILLLAVRTADGQLRTSLDRHTRLCTGDIAVVVGRPAKVRAFARAVRSLPSSEP